MRRILYVSGRCFLYKKKLQERYSSWPPIEIDPIVLIDVAKSAMDDIWRYKVYHLRDRRKRADSVKRAAYFTKWVVRLRPIYVQRPVEDADFASSFDKTGDFSLLLNEGFALFLALTTLATETGMPRIALSPDLFGHLLYDLHYRLLNDDALMAIFHMIRDRARGKDIIVR